MVPTSEELALSILDITKPFTRLPTLVVEADSVFVYTKPLRTVPTLVVDTESVLNNDLSIARLGAIGEAAESVLKKDASLDSEPTRVDPALIVTDLTIDRAILPTAVDAADRVFW